MVEGALYELKDIENLSEFSIEEINQLSNFSRYDNPKITENLFKKEVSKLLDKNYSRVDKLLQGINCHRLMIQNLKNRN